MHCALYVFYEANKDDYYNIGYVTRLTGVDHRVDGAIRAVYTSGDQTTC